MGIAKLVSFFYYNGVLRLKLDNVKKKQIGQQRQHIILRYLNQQKNEFRAKKITLSSAEHLVCSALKKELKCGKNEEKPCLNGFQPIFPGHVGTQKPDIGYLSYLYSLARFFMVHVLLQILFTKNLIIHVQYLKHFEYLLCTCNTLKIGLNTCTENLLA